MFCTETAAPSMRRILLDKCGLVCHDISLWYGDVRPIDHVEHWCATMPPEHPTHAHHLAKSDVPQLLLLEGVFAPGSVPMGPDIVQLIVAKEPATSALCMIEGFDLEACKTHYDGVQVHVRSPGQTLGLETVCALPQRNLAQAYVSAVDSLESGMPERQHEFAKRFNIKAALRTIPPDLWQAAGFGPYGYGERQRRRYESMLLSRILSTYTDGVRLPTGCCIEHVQGLDERHRYIVRYVIMFGSRAGVSNAHVLRPHSYNTHTVGGHLCTHMPLKLAHKSHLARVVKHSEHGIHPCFAPLFVHTTAIPIPLLATCAPICHSTSHKKVSLEEWRSTPSVASASSTTRSRRSTSAPRLSPRLNDRRSCHTPPAAWFTCIYIHSKHCHTPLV